VSCLQQRTSLLLLLLVSLQEEQLVDDCWVYGLARQRCHFRVERCTARVQAAGQQRTAQHVRQQQVGLLHG
jgi:hypothetical protein